jgi:hypothetical protein
VQLDKWLHSKLQQPGHGSSSLEAQYERLLSCCRLPLDAVVAGVEELRTAGELGEPVRGAAA